MADTAGNKGQSATSGEGKGGTAGDAVPPSAFVGGVAEIPQEIVPQPLRIDDSAIRSDYTNHVRVTGTPEEVILDVSLNKDMPAGTDAPQKVMHRIVLSFYTAKRLLNALAMSVTRHEANFGRLETDVRRRLVKKQP